MDTSRHCLFEKKNFFLKDTKFFLKDTKEAYERLKLIINAIDILLQFPLLCSNQKYFNSIKILEIMTQSCNINRLVQQISVDFLSLFDHSLQEKNDFDVKMIITLFDFLNFVVYKILSLDSLVEMNMKQISPICATSFSINTVKLYNKRYKNLRTVNNVPFKLLPTQSDYYDVDKNANLYQFLCCLNKWLENPESNQDEVVCFTNLGKWLPYMLLNQFYYLFFKYQNCLYAYRYRIFIHFYPCDCNHSNLTNFKRQSCIMENFKEAVKR